MSGTIVGCKKSAEWFTENPWNGEAEIHEDWEKVLAMKALEIGGEIMYKWVRNEGLVINARRRTRALKPAAATRIRGSRSSGLAARPRSRRCSECCDSIHPPAGHIYQCVPSFERAEYEIAESWQLGEQRTGGAAI